MDRRRHMGVAEVEHVGAGGIEERGAERIDALAPAEQCRLLAAGECRERLQRGLERLIAAAGQRHGEEIHQRALGLMGDLGRQILPARRHDELGQTCSHAPVVRHPCPRKMPESIGRRAYKCKASK